MSGVEIKDKQSSSVDITNSDNINIDVNPCNIPLENFTTLFNNLTLADKCPSCNIVGGRHLLKEIILNNAGVNVNVVRNNNVGNNTGFGSNNLLDPVSLAFIKLKKELPEFSNKSGNVRDYLKGIELILKGVRGIPSDCWSQVFLFTVKEQSAKEWITDNIIDKHLTWDESKTIFINHFQKAEYSALLMNKFHQCKQETNESVQSYSDRFVDVCDEMNESESKFVFDHYVRNLNRGVQQKYHDYMSMKRIEKGDLSYQLESLEKLITVCISIDVATKTSVVIGGSSGSQHGGKADVHHSKNGDGNKYCTIHKTSTHNTSECKSRLKEQKSTSVDSGGKSSSGNKGDTDKSKVRCWKCKELGHYANECKAQVDGTTAPAAVSSETTLAKRTSQPPARLTYTTPGNNSTSTTVSGKAAIIVGGDVETKPNGKSSMVPGRIWLYDVSRNKHFACLLDTGADTSFIDTSIVKELNIPVNQITNGPKEITLAQSGTTVPREGVTHAMPLTAIFSLENDIALKPIVHSFELMKLDRTQYQFIIGTDLIHVLFPTCIPVEFYTHQTNTNKNVNDTPSICKATINIQTTDELVENVQRSDLKWNVKLLDEMVSYECAPPEEEVYDKATVSTSTDLEADYAMKRELILNDADIQREIEINEKITGFCNLPESILHLDVRDEFIQRGYRKQYNVPHAAEEAVTIQVDKWLAGGKIKPASPNCPFNSPLTVAAKKDAYGNFNGWRICEDVRFLNSCIELMQSDRFQLPYIRDVLEQFNGCLYFGEIDLSEAYLQFQLDEASQPYTAFTWKGIQYQFVGCPFGISILPSYFQRLISFIFHDLQFVTPYIDNVPFGSKSVEEHKQHLLLILRRCNQYNLKIKLTAMKICHSEIRCLGHLLTNQGIALSPTKIDFVVNCERPVTGKQLQSFLGMLTFLRPNIRHVADITAALENAKTTKGVLNWNQQMIDEFEAVKQAVGTAPVLAYPDFSKWFHIATDASNVGIGGVLYQPNEYGGDITADNIVAVVSKKLSGSQLNYPVYKKELYSIVYCLRKFRTYVWGQPDLVIYTDHKPLTYILEQKELSPALQQWLDVLLDYKFEIRYREGKLNILPDCLSRLYAAEYESNVWGVPNGREIPWKFNVQAGSADEHMNGGTVVTVLAAAVDHDHDEADAVGDELNPAIVNFNGGGNAPNVALEIKSNENLVDALIQMERLGVTIPTTQEEKHELMDKQHAFGHFGRDAVVQALIKSGYWWRGMRSDVMNRIASCDACNRFTVVRAGFNPSGSIIAHAPWDHIQLDTSVHLPPAPGGFKVLLVVIDVFTGFIVLRPIKTTNAELVAYELWLIFCLLGLPKIIQSDNGPEFCNEVIRALVKLVGIEHRLITAYNPRVDGKVERSIQSIMSIIKKMLHGTENNWILYVPFAQLAFNNKITSLTGSTPFSLMYGRNLNPMKDYTNDEQGEHVNLDEWKQHMEQIQSLVYPAIIERVKDRKSKMIEYLNKKRKVLLTPYPVGAVVMLKDPNRRNKFEPKYIGPYSIIKRTRNGNYCLRDETGEDLGRVVPPDQLKLISKQPREEDIANNVYEVEQILDHRGEPGTYEYKVKWKYYNDVTWEPEQSFRDVATIRDYWSNKQND